VAALNNYKRVSRQEGEIMRRSAIEPKDSELDAIAWGFLDSPYASQRFVGWSIDGRLYGYLRHCGLTTVADDRATCAALLERVLANIASALDDGTLRPSARKQHESHPKATG
jgi:hypothetical protein